MSPAATTPTIVKETHLLRGILWGIPFGLGLAIVLILTKVIPLTPAWVLGVFVGGIVVGALWSMFGPAKGPKGPPPAQASPAEQAPPQESTLTDTPVPPESATGAPAEDMPPPPPDAPANDD